MKNKMKKIVAVAMTMFVLISAVSCGGNGNSKSSFEMSKEAYNEITNAYEIVSEMSSDIYNAWHLAVYAGEDLTISMLAEYLNITETEIIEGICKLRFDEEYETASEEELQEVRNNASYAFSLATSLDNGWQFVIWVIENAYEANGKLDEAKASMNDAKSIMKEMSAKYSDYEHYPSLKGYFTSTNSFLSWCEFPDGSFEQAKTTINEYKNEIRDYQKDLDYIFVD